MVKWHKTKIPDMNIKENQDAWRQRLFVSIESKPPIKTFRIEWRCQNKMHVLFSLGLVHENNLFST